MGSKAPIYQERRQGKKKKATVRWVVDFRYLGGKRERFATQDEAKAARDIRLAELHRHGSDALHLTLAERQELVIARDRLAKLGLTVDQAVDFCARHYVAPKSDQTLSKAVEELMAIKEATNKRPRSVANLRYTLQGFAAVIGGDRPVGSITREEIEKWLFGQGWAPATIRTKLIDIRTFFRAGLKRGWLLSDPTAAIEAVEMDDKAPAILTVAQAEALLAATRAVEPGLTAYVALALFCGIRPEEIRRMRASDVALDRGYVEVRAEIAKTRQRRLVEIALNCKAWLALGDGDIPPRNLQHRLNRVRVAAGFEGYRRSRPGGRTGREARESVPGIPWAQDILRHSFASYHLAMHGSADKTALQLGHRSTDMLFRHYRELVTRQDAEQFWRITPR